ncbi:sensor histidine kinase [Clostridium botulinum]|uniref:sensor histidine kinase n=1 Tax=Clostridium botulinum TaxID=1491 RepID=UPI0006A3ECCD|nr:HAMP domain-containing sensor histidine kinase [Clostridium botulinum]KOC44563.1 hypothetical protein ADU84_01000 [Clostridium botulinum]
MKIWKKIFLCTLILFIVVFNGAGIIVIENIYHKNMDISVKSALNNEKDIINLIYLNSDLLQGYIGDDLWNILKNYIYSDSNEIKNIEIFNDKNKQILKTSNLNIPNDREELKNEHMDKIKFLIRTINSKKYVSVVSMIKIGTGSYKIVMSKDITYVNQDRIDNYKIFLLLSLVVTLILAIGLYIISKKITNPIESLIEVSNSIRKGEYNKRAYYKKNDEIGVLSQNFNSMMTVIEDNICELKQVNDEKQRFIDNLTHEMKTPITSIIGYSDLLLKSNINDEIRFKALTYINSEGHRLEKLNTSLIKLIMIRNKEIEGSKVSIKEIVKYCVAGLNYKLEQNNITIIKNIEDRNISGDVELIGVLLNNILENAIKASKYNSSIKVIGNKLKDNCKYQLKIEDKGIGISKEDLNKIKEPFYMVDKSRATRGKNMGLGLAICTDICYLNNIEFKIQSKLNIGTIVTLIFNMESFNDEEEI